MNKAFVVVDLGFGDSGKGSIVDYLVRRKGASAVVRYNGGPQAAHRVVTSDGREHVFAQFGSGTFVPGVETFIGRHMLINPLNYWYENAHLQEIGVPDALQRLTIDGRCLVITPYHVQMNRLREVVRGSARHGSCGQGVGETYSDSLKGLALRAEDLGKPDLVERLTKIYLAKTGEAESMRSRRLELRFDWPGEEDLHQVAASYAGFAQQVRIEVGHRQERLQWLHSQGPVIYEGAQGVLLDQDVGFHPHTTWSRTTDEYAQAMIGNSTEIETIGVLRAYATRHGPGPFPTEDGYLSLPDAENGFGEWQREFRVGHFDALLARYAIGYVDGLRSGRGGIALTCLDRHREFAGAGHSLICTAYRYRGTLPDLEPYFRLGADGAIRDIHSYAMPPRSHSEALATRLFACRPDYEEHDAENFVAAVEKELGLPVVLTSHGPTADDKVETDVAVASLTADISGRTTSHDW